jgi:hypothetical protein
VNCVFTKTGKNFLRSIVCILSAHYAGDLAKTTHKILLLSEVAALARSFERQTLTNGKEMTPLPDITQYGMDKEQLEAFVLSTDDDDDTGSVKSRPVMVSAMSRRGLVMDPKERDPTTGKISQSQKIKIVELLGLWCVSGRGISVDASGMRGAVSYTFLLANSGRIQKKYLSNSKETSRLVPSSSSVSLWHTWRIHTFSLSLLG